jgi:DNA-binding response OmpR family regulator
MSGLQKVLVVDNGDRTLDSALSAELAEMGFASVTTPFEAADDVLAIMPSPAAIVLQMPRKGSWDERTRFLQLARRLKATLDGNSIPVILVSRSYGSAANLVLQSKLGARVPAQADA